MNRRPPTGARQPKDAEPKARVHIAIAPEWLKTVEQAARALNLSRSNFLASAVYEVAQRKLKELKKQKAKAA